MTAEARHAEVERAWTERERAIVLETRRIVERADLDGFLLIDEVIGTVDLRHPRPTHQRRPPVSPEQRTQTEIEGTEPGAPVVPRSGAEARDEVLNELSRSRAELIAAGTEAAFSIWRQNGSVTSVEVMAQLRENPALALMLKACDPRWIGNVLLPSKGWKKLGYVAKGSRGRPIPEWTRKT